MSDFKITGNPNPVVGKEEFYTIGNALSPLFPQTPAQKSPFDTPVLWTVHVLEYGRWRKTKENDKKGDKVSYTFLQRSLERNGIRIMASKGDQVARIDIKAQPADKPKIESIELLDKSGKKPSAPLSYGQTLKARVHCLHMERRKVYVTLWEDDAKSAGHSKANEKNLLEMRSGIVKDGIVDIDFLLKPSFTKIAKMSKDEGKIHEYYVTTDFDDKKLASKNVNVNDVETPVGPYKGKTTTPPQQPAKTTPPVQTTKPKTSASCAQTSPKGAITKVHITDTANHAIKGVFKEKQLKVWIDSNGLIGKEIRLRLYDEDLISNDLLVDQKFTITSNIFPITVTLNKIPRSKGGYSGEGDEQELFAEVEVLQTQKSTVSEIVNVDVKAFKQDENEVLNKVLKVFQPSAEDKKKEEKGACPNCDKPITAEELKKIFTDANNDTLTKAAAAYSKYMKELGMNTCWNKAHFFAQASVEVGMTFTLKNGENLNYSTKRLIDGDYSADFVKGDLATKKAGHFTTGKFHKRPFSYFDTHKDEAEKYGRKDLNKNNDGLIQKADQEMIANLAYGPNSKPGKEIGNINSTDGWKFRGRGLVQLTGRGNYDKVNLYTVKHENVNIIDNPEKVNEVNLAVLTSMGYWKNHGGDKKANGQLDENVLSRIIGNDVDYAGKKKSFDKVTSKIFQISECKFGKAESSKEEEKEGNVTIRLVRKWETEISTIGEFSIDGSDIKGYMLEEKGPDTTVSGIEQRIPVGTYNLKWHNGTKQKGVLKLYNNSVPESRAILIHSGNDATDTEGCLLAGSTRSKDFVGSSKQKLKEINDYVTLKGVEGAKIIITANYE